MGQAGFQDRLEGLLHFGGVLGDSQKVRQIGSLAQEERANARRGRYGVDIFQTFGGFDQSLTLVTFSGAAGTGAAAGASTPSSWRGSPQR